MEGTAMKKFWQKQLPAVLLALVMTIGLMPAAMAEDWSGGKEDCPHKEVSESVSTEASCSTPGLKTITCTSCGAVKTEVISATGKHSYGDWSKLDDSRHQRRCINSGCDKTEEASHSFTTLNHNATDHWYECSVCGAKQSEEAHMFNKRGSDSDSHWMECAICGEKDTASVGGHMDEDSNGRCDTCGATVHTHSFPTTWSTSSTQHWHQCSCGEKQSVGTHADSNKDGKCDTCGYKMSSTQSGKNFTITVSSKKDTTVGSEIRSRINSYFSGNFSEVTFDDASGTSYGTLYANSSKKALGSRDYTYSTSGSYPVSKLYFVPKKAGSYKIGYEAVNSSGTTVSGTITIKVSTSSSSGDITYSVDGGETITFKKSDFQKLFYDEYDENPAYVVFETDELDSDYGKLYSGSKTFTNSNLDDYDFYYSSSKYGDYALSSLKFEAEDDFDDEITLDFTIYGEDDDDYVEGTVVISAGESKSSDTISYSVAIGKSVSFKKSDFKKICDRELDGDIEYVTFSTSDTINTTNGTVYYDYGGSDEKSFTKSNIDDYDFYYSTSSSSKYKLENLSFVAPKGASSRVVELDFRIYDDDDEYTSGTVKITVGDGEEDGDIIYKVAPGKSYDFDEDDFNDFYQDEESTKNDIRWVEFTAPAALTSAGTIYYDYGRKTEKSFTRSTFNNAEFFFEDNDDYGDYELDDLTFVASSSFNTAVKIPFRAYRTDSDYTDGTLVLQPEGTTASSTYVGSIRYATTTGTRVQINSNDIARFFKSSTGADLQYVTLIGVPAIGSLYYNYYNTSKYGTTSRAQITATNAGGQVFYASPATTSQFALTELTYVPSGTNYCSTILFTAYGGSRSVSGAILISVSNSTVAEVYGVTPKNTAVTFPASDISRAVAAATGASPASIQLLSLPAYTAGTVYVGTGTSTLANTSSSYAIFSGSQTLRFVPATGYTGSVEIPYVALNSSGTAIATGSFSLGVVNSKKTFSDVTSSTWCYKYVAELSDASVIDGYSNGSFKPNSTVTYGAALKLIMLAAGYPEQKPTGTNVFSGYLAKAREDGIITRSTVDLTKPITRLQVAQLAAGALKLDTSSLSSVKPFTDTSDAAVQALNAAGIVEGYFANGTSTYKPNNTLTRGQVSAIVWRMRNYKK